MKTNFKKMKNTIKSLLLIVLLLGINKTYAQAEIDASIVSAIQKGNSIELAKHFNSSIDLDFPGNDGTFSKTQAEIIIKDLFKKYPPKSFTIKQSGSSNDGSKFSIGIYTSTNNTIFRTYYLIKKVSGKYTIHLLQFEED